MAPEEKNTAVLEESDRLLASDLAGEIEFLTARTRSSVPFWRIGNWPPWT